MKRLCELFLICCIIGMLGSPARATTSKDKARSQAEKALGEALQLCDIRAPGSTPFRLKARIFVNKDKDHAYEGMYELAWNSTTSWRGEFKTPSFSEVRVARGNHLFISRHPSIPLAELFQVLQLLDFPLDLSNPDLKAEKLAEKQGGAQREIKMSVGGRPWITIHLSGSPPEITRIEDKGAIYGPYYPFKDFDSSTELGDYEEFHGHQFPRRITFRIFGKLLEQIQILELVDAPPGPADFEPPPDSHWIRWCAKPLRAKLIPNRNLLPLMPPPQFRAGTPPLHVAIYGVVGTDGLFHNLAVVESAGEPVDLYFEKELARHKFTPAQCDGTPVETEEIRTFDYP